MCCMSTVYLYSILYLGCANNSILVDDDHVVSREECISYWLLENVYDKKRYRGNELVLCRDVIPTGQDHVYFELCDNMLYAIVLSLNETSQTASVTVGWSCDITIESNVIRNVNQLTTFIITLLSTIQYVDSWSIVGDDDDIRVIKTFLLHDLQQLQLFPELRVKYINMLDKKYNSYEIDRMSIAAVGAIHHDQELSLSTYQYTFIHTDLNLVG